MVFRWHGLSLNLSAMKIFTPILVLTTLSLEVLPLSAERINQEGRILDPLPVVTGPLLFNTNYADAVVSAMQIFPVTNPWNECVSDRPVLANSDAMIAQINSDVGSAHRKLELFQEMNFVLLPDNQPQVPVDFFYYPEESDLEGGTSPQGLYPIPTILPIEGWPSQTMPQTLAQWQTNDDGSDRHAILVEPGTGFIWETWLTSRTGTNWQASNGAKFNLNTNGLRPDGWTSGDAAGFPMFPALVRYDECERGMVEHACRLVVVHSRSQHIYPATHDAGSVSAQETNYPAMGQRLRLKAAYVIPANRTTEEKALLLGLKKYGAMVSDNSSSFFSISITPDDRWGSKLDHIINGSIGITNFEVIQTTGPGEGPRSAGAAVANAGSDQTVAPGQAVPLEGFVSFSNTTAVILWKAYAGPGTVTFVNAAQTNTTANFSAPGTYTLELSANDGVHAVAYDAVVITVANGITVSIAPAGTNVNLSWVGGSPPYVVQGMESLPASSWSDLVTTSANSTDLPITNATGYFRVKGQ
jgi:hypothetical protein